MSAERKRDLMVTTKTGSDGDEDDDDDDNDSKAEGIFFHVRR